MCLDRTTSAAKLQTRRSNSHRAPTNFSESAEPLLQERVFFSVYAYAPDGNWLIYGELRDGVQWDLWALPPHSVRGGATPLMLPIVLS